MVRNDHAHCHEDAISIDTECFTSFIEDALTIARVPHGPDDSARDEGVDVDGDDDFDEAFPVDELTSVSEQISHLERQVLLLLESAIILEAHLLIIDAVEQNEPIGHQDVETHDEQVVERLQTRCTVGELDAEFGDSVDDRLHQDHNSEVLESPSVATTVPEKRSSQVLKAGDGVVSESGRLVALLAHEAKSEVSRLDHINVIGSVADGQRDLTLRELLHEGDDLGLLGGRGAVDDDGLSVDEEDTKVWVSEIVVKSDSHDHS